MKVSLVEVGHGNDVGLYVDGRLVTAVDQTVKEDSLSTLESVAEGLATITPVNRVKVDEEDIPPDWQWDDISDLPVIKNQT